MAQTYQAPRLNEGDYINYTAGSDITAGDVVVIGDNLVAIATSDIASGAVGALAVRGVFDVVIKNESFTAGDAVYWDEDGNPYNGTEGTGAATATGSAGPFMGWAIEDATGGTDECMKVVLRSMEDAAAESLGIKDLSDCGTVTYTAGKILVADGDSFESVAVSGDATLASTGALSLADSIDLGSSGSAGTLDIFASTASKGKLTITCDDQDGNTAVGLKPAAMGQATVISIPDPGAATANVLLTSQANDGVVVTATAAELNQIDGALLVDMTPGTGISTGTGTVCEHTVVKVGGIYHTTILVDLTGLNSGANADDIIGKADTANCHIGQITAAVNGTIIGGRMTCLETPAGGDDDVDLWDSTAATGTEDTDIDDLGGEHKLVDAGDATAGAVDVLTAFPAANSYLYLTAGTGDTNDTYTAGKFLIELWGV